MAPLRSAQYVSLRFGLGLCWIACLAVLAAAGPGSQAVASQDGQAAENGYAYYYFKEQYPLTLDASRIAFLRAPDGRGTVAAEPDLSSYGLDVSAVEPMAVRGWSFVKTTASVRTDAAIRNVVNEIADKGPVDFISPVFVDGEGDPIVVTPYILVGFDRGLDPARAEAILAESGAGEILDRDWANMKRAYRLKSSSRDGFEVLEAANRLARRPEVTFAEPDLMVTGHLDWIPNDTYFPYLWGLHSDGTFPVPLSCPPPNDFDMDAPEAWDITIGDPSVIVVILDCGVQQDHPDLNMYTPGFDATGQGGGGDPVNACDNHGTAVAGCVSGIINNGLGIVGVAPGVRSASARVAVSSLSCDGSGTIEPSWVVDGLAWAESIGARITNASWHLNSPSPAITQKYADTRAHGMVHFGAAGNGAVGTIIYPASLPSVNAVAALYLCGGLAPFSNYGAGLAFSAPGYVATTDRTGTDGYNDGIDDGLCMPSEIFGCNSDGDCGPGETCWLVSEDYALLAGTSFASPYAAGVAALVLSVRPGLGADAVEEVLQLSAVDLGTAGYDTTYGWGFVNAFNAVNIVTSVADADVGPVGFALQSHPNPFATGTNIEYDLGRESMVELRIFDVSGRVVRATPAHAERAGPHEFQWDGTDEAGTRMVAGVYILELRVNAASQTRKVVLLN